MIKIIYNSPAMPQKPYDFDLKKEYDLDKVKGKYIIYYDKDDNREFDIDFIKTMFKPCEGYSWDMLEKENKETKKVSQSNIKQNKKIENGGV